MATHQAVIDGIDEIIARFNKRQMDLPDAFFDRRAQFLINGAPFEALLGRPQADPLILMLTRGPAGFRFTAKGLQHAMPDAQVQREEVVIEPAVVTTTLQLTGTLHTTGEPLAIPVEITLALNADGRVETAAASMDAATLEKLREARRS